MEKHEMSIEDLEDELEKFQTWKMFLRANPRKSEHDLKAEWTKIIEENRSECLFRRGEWLVPEFQGIERRIRKRQAESQVVERVAHIKDQATLDSFLASGKQRLDMAKVEISPAVIDLTDYHVCAPVINSRPMDMPMRASSSGVFLESMGREVSSFLFCSGRRFSISVENRIKQLFCPRGPKKKKNNGFDAQSLPKQKLQTSGDRNRPETARNRQFFFVFLGFLEIRSHIFWI